MPSPLSEDMRLLMRCLPVMGPELGWGEGWSQGKFPLSPHFTRRETTCGVGKVEPGPDAGLLLS